MVALATAPRDTVCRHCGRTTLDGATFARWRKVCTECHKAQKRNLITAIRHGHADYRERPPTEPVEAVRHSPVLYVLQHLGPCPRVEEVGIHKARDYWRTLARVSRAMGYHDQAADWEALVKREVGG